MEVKVMWPTKHSDTNMDRFRRTVEEKHTVSLQSYWDLYDWSIKNIDKFWEEVLRFTEMVTSSPYSQVLEEEKRMNDIPKWFTGCHLNYAENLLRYRDDHVALLVAGEAIKDPVKISYRDLFEQVSVFTSVLKRAGVQAGDRVVGYLPNQQEAVIAMLAATSVGAVWSATSPDFGVKATLNRFQQIAPKVLVSVDKVIYNGKVYDNLEKLEMIVGGLPMLNLTIIVPFNHESLEKDISHITKCCFLPEAVSEIPGLETGSHSMQFKQVPFDHPLYILYSSGTTGPPKCMVHSVGGTLIKHLSEHVLHGNMSRKDVIMFYTTTGWMMWCWLITSLAVGATVVLYDGSPFIPHAAALWDLVDRLGITILGVGAKWLALSESKGVKPRTSHKLDSLHTILSTGSPLPPHSFDYVYRDIKQDILLGSITGGSDIVSCFAGQNPTIPVHRGEIQCCLLGMAVECFNEAGQSVMGKKGELVCTQPFPCMPIQFWNDPDGKKYKSAYFSKFPGIWNHGDFCCINPVTKGIVMLGRSDGTLNPSGIRFGSAEIYSVVEAMKEIQDSLCVSQYNADGEERVILFVKMSPSSTFSSDIVTQIQQSIRNMLSARHVPAVILEIEDIPYTITGKKVEVAVKKIISGEEVTNREPYSNPESLDLYVSIPALQGFLNPKPDCL